MSEVGKTDAVDAVRRRTAVLAALLAETHSTAEVADRTGVSRSTANRAVRELEAAGLVERAPDGYRATAVGGMLLERYRTFRDDAAAVAADAEVVAPLPPGTDLDPAVLCGAETYTAGAASHPVERLQDLLAAADRYRALTPALEDRRHPRLLYEHAVVDGNPAELVTTADVLATLAARAPDRAVDLRNAETFRAFLADDPEFGLALAETDGDTTVAVVVYGETGAVHGLVVNDSDRAVRWARRYYAGRRAGADPAEGRWPDGTGAGEAGEAGDADRLPATLEREGFVRLSPRFFIDRHVADPPTAWRVGLDLAEVRAGYAVQRRTEDGAALSDRLRDALTDGQDCLVVGPPGSGKSTVCKQVAVDWYTDGPGPALYRRGGRGQAFESVVALERALDRADGHALVVVEDAVRPDATRALAAADRLADRDDVSFLFDARESEWHDPPAEAPTDRPDLRVETVPRLLDRDYERLVAQFERTAGVEVDAPTDRLREDLRQPTLPGGAAPNEMLLLLHRLSRYADPVADGQTTLEDAVVETHESLARGDTAALDAAMVVNLLNVAGVPTGPATVRAVAGEEADEALRRLRGRVLFGADDSRVVHEAWSVIFLSVALARDGEETARSRLRRGLSALFAGADADGAAAADREGPSVVTDGTAPAVPVAHVVERTADVGHTYPRLATLVGDDEGLAVDVPDGASVSEHDLRARLGQALLSAGRYDRAEAVFEALGPDRRTERLLGLAGAARGRGDYEAAVVRVEKCLDAARAAGRESAAARACLELGRVAVQRGSYDRARDHLTRARETFARLGDRHRVAECLDALGRVAQHRSAYCRAEAYHEWALQVRRDRGDRRGEAATRKRLGTVAFYRGEYDLARDRYGHSLDLARWLGDRKTEAAALNNLAITAMMTGEYDRAREWYEESLAASRAAGDRQTEATVRQNLGEIAEREGAYERAREQYAESLAISRDLGDSKGEAASLHGLGKALRQQGHLDRARERVEESIARRTDLDDDSGRASARTSLAAVARDQGRYGEARDQLRTALETVETVGDHGEEVYVRYGLGATARRRGADDRAREHLESSLVLARDLDNSRVEARTLRELGALERRAGDVDRARDRLAAALDLFEDLGDTAGLVTTRVERGRVALAADRPERARERARTAHEAATETDSDRLLARTHRLLGRVEAATGATEAAREHLQESLTAAETAGAADEELRTLCRLVEVCRAAGDEAAAREWADRAQDRLAAAPSGTADRHRGWVAERRV